MRILEDHKEIKDFNKELIIIANRVKEKGYQKDKILLKAMYEYQKLMDSMLFEASIEHSEVFKKVREERKMYLDQLESSVYLLRLLGVDASMLTMPRDHVEFIIKNQSELKKRDTDSVKLISDMLWDFVFCVGKYPKDFKELKEWKNSTKI